MGAVLRLPAHVVVVDELRAGDLLARGVEGEVDHRLRAAHRPAEARRQRAMRVMIDSLVDDVVAVDHLAVTVGHGLDVRGQQPLRLSRRIGAEVVIVEPLGKPLRPMPQQCVAAHRQALRLSPLDDRVHSGEVELVRRRPRRLPLELVLGNDQPAFAGDNGGIGQIVDPAPAPPADATAEAPALSLRQGVERRGRHDRYRRRRGENGCDAGKRGRRKGPERGASGQRKGHSGAGSIRGTRRWMTKNASK